MGSSPSSPRVISVVWAGLACHHGGPGRWQQRLGDLGRSRSAENRWHQAAEVPWLNGHMFLIWLVKIPGTPGNLK